jgi:trehalose synthase-fused probable maltokinase
LRFGFSYSSKTFTQHFPDSRSNRISNNLSRFMNPRDPDATLSEMSHQILFSGGLQRRAFEENLLPAYVPRCRWFAGKARDPRRFTIRDVIPISGAPAAARLMIVDVEYADRGSDTWLLPVQFVSDDPAVDLAAHHPHAIISQFAGGALCDAIHDAAFRSALLDLIATGGTLRGEHGVLVAQPGPALQDIDREIPSRALAVEQSNSSIVYGDRIFLKLYRRLEAGLNPDAEILRFLTRQGFTCTPPFAGSIEYRDAEGRACVIALATGLVTNNGDAWSFTLRELARWFGAHLENDTIQAAEIEEQLLSRAAQLGTRTGEMHRALASDTADSDFAPQPLTVADGQALADSIRASAKQVAALISAKLETLPDPARNLAQRYLDAASKLEARISSLNSPVTAAKTRTHGDYHLGQVLETGGDFAIIDFEGEPLRSLATRRERRSPFRDVAGMLRSFDYAAHAALDAQPQHQEKLAAHAARWSEKAQSAFLEAWRDATGGAVFRAGDPVLERALLDAFLLEKALYEVVYEINNRPTWLPIPLRGVLCLL